MTGFRQRGKGKWKHKTKSGRRRYGTDKEKHEILVRFKREQAAMSVKGDDA